MHSDEIETGTQLKETFMSANDLFAIVSNYISRKTAEELDYIHSVGGKSRNIVVFE